MDFLYEPLQAAFVESAPGSKSTTFAADAFDRRPPIEDILNFRKWADDTRGEISNSLARASCKVASIQFLIDTQGLLVITTFKAAHQICNAKSNLLAVLRALEEPQRLAIATTLRPFDELDKIRLDSMETVTSLRPFVAKEKPEEPVHGWVFMSMAEGNKLPRYVEPHRTTTLANLLTETGGAVEEVAEEEDWQQRLALADVGAECDTLSIQHAKAEWISASQKFAAIVVFSVGEGVLTYIRCVHENRRIKLLARGVFDKPTFLDVVRAGMALVETGALPDPKGGSMPKTTFLRRCVAVLKVANPDAEHDLKKLPQNHQSLVAALTGTAMVCSMCPSTATVFEEWDAYGECWWPFKRELTEDQLGECGPVDKVLPTKRNMCEKCSKKFPGACVICRSSARLRGGSYRALAALGAIRMCGIRCECGGAVARCEPRAEQIYRSSSLSNAAYNMRISELPAAGGDLKRPRYGRQHSLSGLETYRPAYHL
jgi:hypothetical protein